MKVPPVLQRIAAWPTPPARRGGVHAPSRAGARAQVAVAEPAPEPVVAVAAVPEVVCCLHCTVPIRFVDGQGWIHVEPGGTFGCRNHLHMFTGTLAEPQIAAQPAAGPIPPSVVEAIVLAGGSA